MTDKKWSDKKKITNCGYCGKETKGTGCCAMCNAQLIKERENNQPWGWWRKS